jgi:hypothetical protein
MWTTVFGEPADSILDILSIKMHGIIAQKTVILIFTTVGTSSLTQVQALWEPEVVLALERDKVSLTKAGEICIICSLLKITSKYSDPER